MAVSLIALVLLWLLDELEPERGETARGETARRELPFVGPTLHTSCLPLHTDLTKPLPLTSPFINAINLQPDKPHLYRCRKRLPVLREVEDSDDDVYTNELLLDEGDLSALAEASMKLEELEETVSRILSQVELEQGLQENTGCVEPLQMTGRHDFESESGDDYSYTYSHEEKQSEYICEGHSTLCADEIDRYSRELDEQLSDLERCARAYGDGINVLGCVDPYNDRSPRAFPSEVHEYPCTYSDTDVENEDGEEEEHNDDERYHPDYYSDLMAEGYESDPRDLGQVAQDYERDLAHGYDSSNDSISSYPCGYDVGSHYHFPRESNCTEDRNVNYFEYGEPSKETESYSDRLKRILRESCLPQSHIPELRHETDSFVPSCSFHDSERQIISPERCDYSEPPLDCSLEDLEKCIDKLVLDVEREEARLRQHVKNRLQARSARFSMPMPPRPLSEVPRETFQGRASSMDSLLRLQPLHDIWWEGAYRNMPQTPDGQDLSESDQQVESSASSVGVSEITNGSDIDDSMPVRAEIMLLVRTTETGKDTIEIRSIRHVDSSYEGNFYEPRCVTLSPLSESPPESPNLQRIFVHSPPNVHELRTYSLEDLSRPFPNAGYGSSLGTRTLPERGRRSGASAAPRNTDPFRLEFSPPPSLVQYVVSVQPSDTPPASSPTPCPVEYVTPSYPGPTPGRGYCTWLPNPSPRGKTSNSYIAAACCTSRPQSKRCSTMLGSTSNPYYLMLSNKYYWNFLL